MKEETQAQFEARHAIPVKELPSGISRGWRFAGEKPVSTPEEAVEPVLETESFQADLPSEDYLDYEDSETTYVDEYRETQDLLYFLDESSIFWRQFMDEFITREENALMANEATIDWLEARNKLRKLFTGTHKGKIRVKRKRQDFNEVEENHGWYGGKNANDRDDRRQSRIKDWEDDVSTIELSQDDISTSRPGSDHENFDWDAFNAEVDAETEFTQRSRMPVDERDTRKFKNTDRSMRNNAPRHTAGARAIR